MEKFKNVNLYQCEGCETVVIKSFFGKERGVFTNENLCFNCKDVQRGVNVEAIKENLELN